MRAPIVLTLMLAALAGSAHAQRPPTSVLGAQVRVQLPGAVRLHGELLAAARDSLWLLSHDDTVLALALRNVTRVDVRQGGLTSGTILLWTVVGGLVTGSLLAGACSSVEDAACGGVLPATMASWGVVGGISAAKTGPGTRSIRTDAGSLAPYARFPQGLPAAFRPGAVARAALTQPDTTTGKGRP